MICCPARFGFGLQVRPPPLGCMAEKGGALLDLVGGDRLVVDEHDDGLLARCRGWTCFVGLGRRPLRGGLAGRRLRGELRSDATVTHDRTRSQDDCEVSARRQTAS